MQGPRRRASTPKVKTGCLTWARHVKCDEARPKCATCKRSREVCRGYPDPVAYKPRIPVAPASNVAHQSAPTLSRRNMVVAVPRELVVEISPDATERRYFQLALQATRGGVALHVLNVSPVWSAIMPQLAHRHRAISHALIALGATYHLYKTSGARSRAVWPRQDMTAQEIFILTQYTRAARELQDIISSAEPQGPTVALMCSLIFVCLENLRGDFQGAASHLQIGVRILETSVDVGQLFFSAATPSSAAWSSSPLPLLSNGELKGLANYLLQLEMSTRLFYYALPMRLTGLVYACSRNNGLANNNLPERFTNLAEAHAARTKLARDAMGRDREMSGHRGDLDFWSCPQIQQEQAAICQRAARLNAIYKDFLADVESAPTTGTRFLVAAYADMLGIQSMQAVLEMVPFLSSQHGVMQEKPVFRAIVQGMVHYGELLLEARSAARANEIPDGTLDFTVEVGLVAPMYFAYVYTSDANYRRRALKVLSQTETREGPWDARALLKLISVMSQSTPPPQPHGAPVNPLRRWGGQVDCMGLFSHLKISDW